MDRKLREGFPTLFHKDYHAEASFHVWEGLHSSLRGAILEALFDLSHEMGDAAGNTTQNHPSNKRGQGLGRPLDTKQ